MNESEFELFCQFVRNLIGPKGKELELEKGRRYIKMLAKQNNSTSYTAWAFVEIATGEIFKPASLKAPLKGSRGNINNPASYKNYRWTGPHYLI